MVTWTGRVFLPRVPAGAKAWVTTGEGDGGSLKLHPLPLPLAAGRPAQSLDRKRTLSFWLLTNTGLTIGQDHHWKRARCDGLLPGRSGSRVGGEGAATGAGRPSRLGYRSAASAGLGSLVISTSRSGLYSLGFVWNRKC